MVFPHLKVEQRMPSHLGEHHHHCLVQERPSRLSWAARQVIGDVHQVAKEFFLVV